ncbi:MAG: hypothetical protein H6598_03815 [Flavobacteriales bacterium]|nr:hypothetical protein [Flavobacteriales bacterium]
MKEYKLNKDKKETTTPSDEVINKFKNFDKLRVQYDDIVKPPKQPLYKNRKLFLFLIMIGLVSWLVSIAVEEEQKEKEKEEKQKTEARITPYSNFFNSSSGSI